MNEQQLQSKIKNNLKAKGWIVIKTIRLSEAGYPDLFCFKGGRTVFIEVKAGDNKPTPLQNLRHEQLRAQGFEVIVTNTYLESI